MTIQEIEALVVRAKNNDSEAINKLINVFMPYINSLASKFYIASMDKDDLRQECFITLLSCLSKYSGTNTFVAYVTNAMRNNIVYMLRKSTKIELSIIDNLIKSENDTLNDLIKSFDLFVLTDSINLLPVLEKSIIQDYFFNKISLTDIAKKNNLKYITTVKKKDRALKKLLKLID